ncbi:MAG: DNA-binding protein [Candidatus Micrarchaeota archaeon]
MNSDDNEAQEARKRQIAEMQRELQLREFLRKVLDDKAFERISNIRLADKEFYLQLAQLLAYAYQQGQVRGKLGEKELIALIGRLKSEEKEPTITIKRK